MKCKFVALLLIFSFSNLAWMQSKTITGKVIDENMSPLPGVSIVIKGTTIGTQTNFDGEYSLGIDGSDVILVFSYLGYKNLEKTWSGESRINIQLTPDLALLDEVVVVGYGTVKKSDLTGSLSSVKGDQLREVPTAGVDQALQGRAAGVNITKDSGAPGGGVTVQIRGVNSINGSNAPLYVIDGFPVVFDQGSDFNGLSQLNPGEIESIEVLKDASATAIYGTRGANGVIMITTKKGKAGKTTLEFSSFQGISTISKLDVLNTPQFAGLINDLTQGSGNSPVYSDINSLPNIDYQEEVLTTGQTQNYQLAYTHGNENTQYSLIGSVYKEDGVVKNTGFDRYTLRFNAAHKMNDKLQIGNNLTASFSEYNIRNTTGRGGGNGGVIQSALLRPPNAPIRDNNGNYIYSFENYVGDNPVSLVNEPVNERLAFSLLGNLFMNYEIINNLTLRISLGGNIDNIKNNIFFPTSTFIGENVDGSASVSNATNYNWLNENTLNYKFSIGDSHEFDLLAGYTLQYNEREFVFASGEGFASEEFLFNNLAAATLNVQNATNKTDWGLASYLFRANYKLKDKYLFTFTLRADGSSRFGEDNKWGIFPSGAFAWKLSDEQFIAKIDQISNAKLRMGYGVTGNQPNQLYGSLALLSNNVTDDYVFNGNRAVAIAPAGVANPNLGWETTEMLNFGLDLGLFSNRLNLTFDIYQKTTDDLLFATPVPEHIGLGSVLQNIGSVENKGFELSLDGAILSGPLTWNAGINISQNRNKVTELVGDEDILRGDGPSVSAIDNFNLLREGEPLTTFFGYQIDGVYQTEAEALASGIAGVQAGDLIRRDVNGDGSINDQDRIIIGDAQPDFTLGFNTSLKYKEFDLSLLVNGVFGNDILNLNRFELFSTDLSNNVSSEVLNFWNGPNTSNTIPRLGANIRNQSTSYAIEDGSFIRLRNITLGYTIPEKIVESFGIDNLRFYVTGQNLITITDYSGFDPEVNGFANNGGGNSNIQGLDYGTYPRPRTFLMGLSVQF